MKNRIKIVSLALLSTLLFASCETDTSTSLESTSSTSSSSSSSSLTSSSTESSQTSSSSVNFDDFEFDFPSWPELDKDVYPQEITFYSMNDTHGNLLPDEANEYPGFVQTVYEIKHQADFSASSVLVSSGDMFQGTALSNISEGYAMVDAMNMAGFTGMAIGNHEFDWGTDALEKLAERANFPFLGVNILNQETSQRADFAGDYCIINRGKAKIGIIGSIGSDLESDISASVLKGYEFVNEYDMVSQIAKSLKSEENCDIVILLTHQSPDTGLSLLNIPEIDGIFGGHDHQTHNETASGKKFISAGCNSSYYGQIKFVYSQEDGKYICDTSLESTRYQEVYYNPTKYDENVMLVANKYNEVISVISETVIGKRRGELVRYNSDATSSLYGYAGTFLCEAMMYYATELNPVDNVVAAFHNTGGVRSSWVNTNLTPDENGLYNITIGDLYSMSPFDNMVQYVDVKGSDLIDAYKDHYNSLGFEEDPSSYNSLYLNGEKIVSSNIYRVVTIDFVITRKSDPLYSENGGTNLNGELAYIRDVVSAYVQHLGTVEAANYTRS